MIIGNPTSCAFKRALGALARGPLAAAVDLKISRVLDSDELSIGGLVAVNDDRDEMNQDAQGQPRLDNQPDAAAGHRIVGPTDADLLPAELALLSSDTLQGTWTLTFSDKIKVWRLDQGMGNYVEVTSGQSSPSITVSGETKIQLLIEGISPSITERDVEIQATFTPASSSSLSPTTDTVRVTVAKLDLAIDSNNDDAIDASDDPVEDIAGVDATPGQVIVVNDDDRDGDSIPDYADGYNLLAAVGYDDTSSATHFTPLVLSGSWLWPGAEIEVSYDASDPLKVTDTPDDPFARPAGSLRVWTLDADSPRNGASLSQGGDYLRPGTYTLDELGLSPTVGQSTVTLYVEALDTSATIADKSISVVVRDPTRGIVFEDRIRLTAVQVQFEGLDSQGVWQPVSHMIATSFSSSAEDSLPEAATQYRVAVLDPRTTGISQFTIDGQSLTLTPSGGAYYTSAFYALTPDSATPFGNPLTIVLDDPDVDWEYNPKGKGEGVHLPDLHEWDKVLHDEIKAVSDEMVNENWQPQNPNDPGAFGKEVHNRLKARLNGRTDWLVDVYVDKDNRVLSTGGPPPGKIPKGSTQVDVLHVEDGYTPTTNQPLDRSKVDDLYEVKTSASGRVDPDQRNRLSKVLNDPNAEPKKIKAANTPKRFQGGKFVDNPSYIMGFKILSMVGVVATSVQSAHAMWTFDAATDEDFQKVLMESEKIRNGTYEGGDRKQAILLFTNFTLRPFLAKFVDENEITRISLRVVEKRLLEE